MSEIRRHSEIFIVGAGPAGIAAAVRAADCGAQVSIIDDNPAPGGQIWRGERQDAASAQGSLWFRRLENSRVNLINGARLIAADAQSRTLLVDADGPLEMRYTKLILATGARELFLPFPGWTLPNVLGVGGLQALVKCGLPVERKRIVVAGSGPLLLAAASYFHKHGAIVTAIAEQARWSSILRFGLGLLRYPAKLWQAARLKLALRASRYLPGCWVEAALGADKIETVRLHRGKKTWTEPCDYLACAFGLWPNIELATLLGCKIVGDFVHVDDLQQTSVNAVYCAGECTGIGGLDLSLIEGQIAGYAAAGRDDLARRFFTSGKRARNFAAALDRTFALRAELRGLPSAETFVCRCEDVTFGRLQSCHSWQSAKLHMRCGMGPCQGRICGPIVQFLFGWRADSVRPPLFPAPVGTLVSKNN